jgi:3-phytase
MLWDHLKMIRRFLALLVGAAIGAALSAQNNSALADAVSIFDVPASVETVSVQDVGDAADDAEIWRNPADPAQSRIFATDKKTGLYVLDLKGQAVEFFRVGRMNNVDLRDGWTVKGREHVLVAASDRSLVGITFFTLDPATLSVAHLAGSFVAADVGDPYGMCLYRSRKSASLYAFVIGKTGEVRQFELKPRDTGEVDATLVRSFAVGSIAEGCVVDDRSGALYIAEEMVGIWRYGAEPDSALARVAIASVDGKDIVADIEGLTLAPSGESGGYLVASIQGNSTFALFSLPDEKLAARFRIAENPALGIDAVTGTDGVAVATGDFGPDFPKGVLVAQDDENTGGTAQNFKIVSWGAVLDKLPTQ